MGQPFLPNGSLKGSGFCREKNSKNPGWGGQNLAIWFSKYSGFFTQNFAKSTSFAMQYVPRKVNAIGIIYMSFFKA
jgi:hypothetical protein